MIILILLFTTFYFSLFQSYSPVIRLEQHSWMLFEALLFLALACDQSSVITRLWRTNHPSFVGNWYSLSVGISYRDVLLIAAMEFLRKWLPAAFSRLIAPHRDENDPSWAEISVA